MDDRILIFHNISSMKLSVAVPVFNEEETIPQFLEVMLPILESQTSDYEVIFALDPSTDKSEEVIRLWNKKNSRVKCLKFSRRIGQPKATLAALEYSSGDAVVAIDVDLQDPPELIPKMVDKWQQGFDVVYAQRSNRKDENFIKKSIALTWYKIINKIADVDIPANTGDFRLMSRRVVNEVVKLKENHGFLRGMVALVGFSQTAVKFERPARKEGETKYNPLWGSIRIGMNGVVCFSNFILSLSTTFGFIISASSFVLGIVYLIMKLNGFPFPMGNPTIVILVLFLGGVQLLCVGILGEYIGRIYDEVKQRPRFLVDTKIGFDQDFSKES